MPSVRRNTRTTTTGKARPKGAPGRVRQAKQAATTLARRTRGASRKVATTVRAATKAVQATVKAARQPLKPAGPPPSVLDPTGQLAAALSDEERIELAKYLASSGRPRLFEEERFVFPQTYGINRCRLLVKDPEWLFAYWDVSSRSLSDMRSELGDRAAALSRLTLRVTDTAAGSIQVILLPDEARAWYVRADTGSRSYQAEVGLTLPSGQFRPLAHSNTVLTPSSGPADEVARRTARYKRGGPVEPVAAPKGGTPAAREERRTDAVPPAEPRAGKSVQLEDRGGASDRFRR